MDDQIPKLVRPALPGAVTRPKLNAVRLAALCALGAGLATIAVPAQASGGKGLTYGLYSHDPALGVDHVGYDGTGNPYTGDTLCKLKRPILCVDVDGSARPPYGFTPGNQFYQGWVEGHYTTTLPVKGTTLTSEAAGDKQCAVAFGAGWRMAEWHDGAYDDGPPPMDAMTWWGTPAMNPSTPWPSGLPHGGDTGWGFGNIRSDTRYWVAINDNQGNCWNP